MFLRFSPSLSLPALALLFLLGFTDPCRAEATSEIFQWAFDSNSVSSTLESCHEFGILVKPYDPNNDTHGVPPFYMRAYEKGGGLITSLLGQNESNLTWTVNNPVGSEILLNVIDSEGSSGGNAPKLFTVGTGTTTNCITETNSTTFTVTSNVTATELQPCQPWGLRIKGGIPPYNISLVQTDSPVVTNVTTGGDDDAYTYINRATSGQIMLAGVSDSAGAVAWGTPSITPTGNTDIDCGSLQSGSGNATALDAAAAAAANAGKNKNHAGLIAGVVVGVLAFLLLVTAGWFFWRRRRQAQKTNTEIDPDVTPYMPVSPMSDNSSQAMTINAFVGHTPVLPHTPKSPSYSNGSTTMSDVSRSPSSGVSSLPPFDPRRLMEDGTEGTYQTASLSSSASVRPGFTNFPQSSIRRPSKTAEGGLTTAEPDSSVSESIGSAGGVQRSQSAMPPSSNGAYDPWPARPASYGTRENVTSTGEGELIIQHRDGGTVRELPPPYADRFSQNRVEETPS
ncbi:uncharacterized protein EV420DRAFT_1648493 [Desarmillaria tabescens]|uniref:Epidermal growth factor receptor-like transmembrane-juxtamembrane segment domain-containing protein n=1 Tax=Armillaria tabescens TaxID=1929756 RepID=A0AA39J3P5_ARMTA|nr:uncharacterized protein EV420DRAFT_1653148 [Desarmillaria tabescens]XP_060325317.1 uncharacterized protein EV420DRAFT_1648493 [Desarmillaria tabescens]KAK0435473.1 hypothetical protein EV420DRAFT_1653148 [Desarmillaria tabescens]KAK0444970.1 hypothetical protein EV420DRAFT_1648493 [Desarmillaria tabescens]